jgi:cellulose synthase/poly-beta-1,6-N-acetylglucosamine synthase-like glycosyltransferase/peptidoglycan/xylan/chitin deacetylase (PgdA/CDA1 family)/spore germination protein YaaH
MSQPFIEPDEHPRSAQNIAAGAAKVKPIFFDPTSKRWPRLRLGMALVALILTVLLGTLVLSILAGPALPSLNLPSVSFLPHGIHSVPHVPRLSPEPPLTRRERALRDAKTKLANERERNLQKLLAQAHKMRPDSTRRQLAIGFFVNWDDSSMSSLKQNLDSLDMVIAEWLHLADDKGLLLEDDPGRQAQVTEYIRLRRPDFPIMPLVNNWNGKEWEGDKLSRMLADPAARKRAIEQLLAYVERQHFAGVSIDFENIGAKSQGNFLRFISDLYAVLNPKGLSLSVNVPADDPNYDYRDLARKADYLILMAYDEHWATGASGPIASLPWLADVLHRRQHDVPAKKMIVAIGNYAYDWEVGRPAEERSFEEAVLTAKESEGNIRLDPVSLNPTFDYSDDYDHVHHVWMLDAVSAFNQLVVAGSVNPAGIAIWRLGSEDPSLWRVFGKKGPLTAEIASQLREVQFGYGLDYEGSGEILQITARPKPGNRDLTFDSKRNLITAETFTVLPSPYVITRHGTVARKVALTFDDGPDARFTPQILDILREAGAPATFFIIGINGERNPDLLRREVAEGHELGNHTFTHPNITLISQAQFELELSATERLLAAVVGRQSLMFRPPFGEDSEPETADQLHQIELASSRGYLIVGMQIDPDDWRRPGVDEIVQRTVKTAVSGEGNVILLHDSGGDRSQTVRALPLIIKALRSYGFQFVTVSELMGLSRDKVMPPIPPDSLWQIWTDRLAFSLLNLATVIIHWLFLLGIVLGIARLTFIGLLAVYQNWRRRRIVYDPAFLPSVAVVVPAYNEEKVIVRTVASLLACDISNKFEIIVVDDGSGDATYSLVKSTFADNPMVRVLTQPNAGKSSALNFGIAHTQAEIVVAMDADTVFARDTIAKLVRHFADPQIGAVAGNTKVGNRINLLTRWQALEYITSQNLDRRAFSILNCITVVPGAVGAWRRELIERAGGFDQSTLAEDADLTMAIRKLGYAIVYDDEAVALTEAPDTVRGFIRQRYRWMFGTMQAAWKHIDALFRMRYGALGFVALPNVMIFQVLFPLISPVMDLLLLGTLGVTAINYWHHPADFSTDDLRRVLFYYALFVTVDYMSAVLAFTLEHHENWFLLIFLFWQRFFYRQLMYYVAIKSTLNSLRGKLVGWGKLERKATVGAASS